VSQRHVIALACATPSERVQLTAMPRPSDLASLIVPTFDFYRTDSRRMRSVP
jgi:hypothetical protein